MKNPRLFAAVYVCFSIVCSNASAEPIIDFISSYSYDWDGNTYTLAYDFNVSDTITIDALGILDIGGDGLSDSHEIGLWTTSGTLLATTTVTTSSTLADPSASGLGNYIYEPIDTLVLGAGDYRIGAFYPSGSSDMVVYQATGVFSNHSSVTFLNNHWFDTSGSFTFPTDANEETTIRQYFGPAAHISSVPIPATVWLFGSGLLGLIGISRNRKTA